MVASRQITKERILAAIPREVTMGYLKCLRIFCGQNLFSSKKKKIQLFSVLNFYIIVYTSKQHAHCSIIISIFRFIKK